MEYSVIFCTSPNKETANKISIGLVEENLAACVNILPNLNSIYRWEGKICNDSELLLIIKTKKQNFDNIAKWIQSNHPYEVPEIIQLPIINGANNYLNWIDTNC